ncbi:hypothetical protein [Mesomycoplasma ovipneumoniae]|uniref:hypothetical protein n=1 Tax=Mesomycoplasma ovipneumoniae TaxID=29562 RepID=UPI0028B06DF3|nr:hypothetical protein [Mesomycoplasma ovipneumoniae]WNM15046.1 hypothetical protein RNM01_00170 [Mesomycoplasma ovipneumoniae]
MKNLELINLLSLGNVVVAQPYENADIKLKNLISKLEANILDKIQDEDAKNLLIREFGNSIDSLDSFTYKQFNYIFRGKVFNNQDQKNKTFQKLRSTSEIYKKFQDLKKTNSRRRAKRSLFSEYQRLTIEDWIDRIQRVVDQNEKWSTENHNSTVGWGVGAGGSALATVSGVAAALLSASGPIGWLVGGIVAAVGLVGTAATGTQIGLSVGSALKTSSYWDLAQKMTKELDSLKAVFRLIKTSNNTDLENGLKERIRKIIANINELSGNTINFEEFDPEEILAWGY